MAKLNEIIKEIEEFAPPELACEWDNSGWQVYCNENEVKNVMLALSPDINVINQAIEKNCELLITHHPLLFGKINKLSIKNPYTATVIKAIKNNLNIYSAHTNLDKTNGGTGDYLAYELGLNNIKTIEEFIKIGNLESEINLKDFINKLKLILNTDTLKIINPQNIDKIKKIALCAGSGADLINKINDVDVFITGDVKYHTALDSKSFIVIDAGHYETEVIYLPILKDIISNFDIDIYIAEEKSPWEIV